MTDGVFLGYLQTHGAKLSFDRSSVGHADYHDRSSIGGESTSSAHGLDVSYGYRIHK